MNGTGATCTFGTEPDLAGNINVFTIFAVIIVVVSFLYSMVVRALERVLERNHPYLRKALSRLYQELTVCGLISLIFLIFYHACLDLRLAAVAGGNVQTVRDVFQWFHLWVFVLFGFYTVFVLLQMAWSILHTRRWHSYEALPIANVRADYEELEQAGRRMGTCARLFHPVYRWKLLSASAVMRYHFLRVRYIQHYSQSERFSFADFLTRRLERECAHALRVHWSFWILILAVILINFGRYRAAPSLSHDDGFAQVGLMVLGWGLLLLGLLVHVGLGVRFLRVADLDASFALAHGDRLLPGGGGGGAGSGLGGGSPALDGAAVGAEVSYAALGAGGGVVVAPVKVKAVGAGLRERLRGWWARVTGLLVAKFVFQLAVFVMVLYLTLLTLYATSLNTAYRLAAVGAAPVVLFVLVPLGQVLPLYTLLTASNFSPTADRLLPRALVPDALLTTVPPPDAGGGLAGGAPPRALPPLGYAPMLQSPFDAGTPPPLPTYGLGGAAAAAGGGGGGGGAGGARRGMAPPPPARAGFAGDPVFGLRTRSDSYTSF